MSHSSYQVFSNNDTNQSSKDVKLFDNGDDTYSLSVKTPVNALNLTDKPLVYSTLDETLATDTEKTLLSIKNNSSKDLRLITFNMAVTSNSPVQILIDILPSDSVDGTYNNYDSDGFSQYAIDSTVNIINPIGVIFGTIILGNSSGRINLIKDDVIIRWGANETLIINGKCKNSADIAMFIRHIEEGD